MNWVDCQRHSNKFAVTSPRLLPCHYRLEKLHLVERGLAPPPDDRGVDHGANVPGELWDGDASWDGVDAIYIVGSRNQVRIWKFSLPDGVVTEAGQIPELRSYCPLMWLLVSHQAKYKIRTALRLRKRIHDGCRLRRR